MQKYKVGIIVVSYNSASELLDCIRSGFSQKSSSIQPSIYVVDNASKDDSVKIASETRAVVIPNKKNVGFSKAVNQGIEKALQDKCNYVLLLNPDAILKKDCIEEMIKCLESDESIGAVGPEMYDSQGISTSDGYYMKAPSLASVLLFSTHLRSWFINNRAIVSAIYQETALKSDREVDQIPGACLLTSREVIHHIGMLDEDFAIWFEDVEWCYRARKAGYKMWFHKNAQAIHEGGVSFSKWQSLDKAVTFYVSMKTFFKKHKPISYPFLLLIIVLNSLAAYLKSSDKSNLTFIKRFLRQKKGILPD